MKMKAGGSTVAVDCNDSGKIELFKGQNIKKYCAVHKIIILKMFNLLRAALIPLLDVTC